MNQIISHVDHNKYVEQLLVFAWGFLYGIFSLNTCMPVCMYIKFDRLRHIAYTLLVACSTSLLIQNVFIVRVV